MHPLCSSNPILPIMKNYLALILGAAITFGGIAPSTSNAAVVVVHHRRHPVVVVHHRVHHVVVVHHRRNVIVR